MFAIYNEGKLSSRGPVETLYNVKKINHINEIHNNKERQFDDFMSSEQSSLNKIAINTYKKNTNQSNLETIYHVAQIMNKEVLYVQGETSVQETYDILNTKNIRQLPIITRAGIIKGMITQKNILNLIIDDLQNAQHSMQKILDNLNLPEVITADPLADIRRVAKVMVDFNLNAIPIVDENDILVGIASRTDILKAVASIPPLQLWA